MNVENRAIARGLFLSLFLSLAAVAQELDPPHIVVGEALFLETRFAEFFHRHANGINDPLSNGDPVMNATATTSGDLFGPFRGKSMNCRACHLVDEHAVLDDQPGASQGGFRSYADFAQRSPIPSREDGKNLTLRNSPSQVNASVPREFELFHFDGEFLSMPDLVHGTLLGRNYGWQAGEEAVALAHIAQVIKEDDGKHPLVDETPEYSEFSYAEILKGTAPELPAEITLDSKYRLDVSTATDDEILDAIAVLVSEYVTDLNFSQDDDGYDTSPYDDFLRKNGLPSKPRDAESPLEYSRRLRGAIDSLKSPQFITPADADPFASHEQEFRFGDLQLQGLKVFLCEPSDPATTDFTLGGIGNCIACHQAPHFTDFTFHNTGVSQEEYDSVHGSGQFAKIEIPPLEGRSTNYRSYLPLKAQHLTSGTSQFADIPSLEAPGRTDLGLWNVFLNPAFPKPQDRIRQVLLRQYAGSNDAALLEKSVAAFKTPGLRDLGHSAPYFHTGRFGTLEDTMRFYVHFSEKARSGAVRNADSELGRIYLHRKDVVPLTAFLLSLNEDYE